MSILKGSTAHTLNLYLQLLYTVVTFWDKRWPHSTEKHVYSDHFWASKMWYLYREVIYIKRLSLYRGQNQEQKSFWDPTKWSL